MEYATERSTTMRMLLASFALVMVMFAIFAGNASAEEVKFEGRELPGKTWTCGHCVLQSKLVVVAAYAYTTSSVCAGAVRYTGSWKHPTGGCVKKKMFNTASQKSRPLLRLTTPIPEPSKTTDLKHLAS